MAARSNLIFQIVFESVFFRDNAKQHNTYYRKPKGGFDGKPKSKNMGLYRLSAIRKYAAAFSGLYKPYIYCYEYLTEIKKHKEPQLEAI